MHSRSGISRRGMMASTLGYSLIASLPAKAAEAALAATIQAGNTGHRISDFMFGGFLEHGGNLINFSLWSEVLDDRKFFHPVNSTPLPPMKSRRGPMVNTARKWMPVGPDEDVTMDRVAPYVGAQSPMVHLKGASPRGIAQDGLALAKKDYTGRIVIAAEGAEDITATLIWGSGRQSVKIDAGREWKTVPLSFTCKGATTNGRIEITAKGTGTFRVGAVSLMPADNINGFRADTIALMKEMDCKILRLPGGNFISAYDWKNTIGDPDKRPPIEDPVWSQQMGQVVQPNDAGVDELLQMCRLIGAEPYWCVNTGFGEPRSGAEILEYVNGAATTEWGAKRAANGHPEPWRVHYWNIGNEMYGHWQMGFMDPEQYFIKHKLFAAAMRKVDPTIFIAAPGGFVDEITTGQGIMPDSGGIKVEYGSKRDWGGGMLKNCWGTFDALQTHTYPPEDTRFDLALGKRVPVTRTLVEWARMPAQRIATMADSWEGYKERFPALKDGKVKVYFDEWAYHFQADYKGCLAIARAFHEFFRHSDFIDMAGYTMATAWLSFDRTNSVISTTGRIFQLYNRHFGRIPVAVSGNSPVPPVQYPIGGDQPKVNTGSPTHPLDVSAALMPDRKALVVAVVNATDAAHPLTLSLEGFRPAAQGRCLWLKNSGLAAQNAVGKAPEVTIAERSFDATAKSFTIVPYAIELYRFEAA
ncbi:alpha-N-arabinofuranosidase [Rhizomicrobium palustre]|uniref:non-reducing end alpha-L-arabinofuranosidase n=1 Tax=Rhizomicrobium palustre TaxID=189966 RepID=A0A846MU76_9PROT|nr:alpha-L-arabinofuranosidase [Rhizomicrobium palustre]NIK86761.1 alpha-N-arabinofuranosidase [Rhizomicrobium palustre]